MKGFKDTTKTESGHGFKSAFGFTGSVAPQRTGVREMGVKSHQGRFVEGGRVQGMTDRDPRGNLTGHGLQQRTIPSTQELKEAGGTSPLKSGFKRGGGSHKHFHVHKHYYTGGKVRTESKSHERSAESEAEKQVEGHGTMMAKGGKSMRPGGGGRFAALKSKLARKGIRNPGALAGSIGREKYGKAKMAEFSARGRHRAAADTGGTINRYAAGGAIYAGGGRSKRRR